MAQAPDSAVRSPEPNESRHAPGQIRTPDQRLRVFVSSTLGELAEERVAVREAVSTLRLSPVMFELGARPHPPRDLYRAYLEQSHIFLGIYWQRYGWVAPGMSVSGLEDEYQLSGERPKLIYVKAPAQEREPRLAELLEQVRSDDRASYKSFTTAAELRELVENDLAVLLTERFDANAAALVGPPPGQLPKPATGLVGRQAEIEAVCELLQREGVRLVTLLGPGGIGKTRLALAAAERLREQYRDGVHFVPLAPVREPDFLAGALVQALGVNVSAGVQPLNAVIGYLRGKQVLLVLDNFEQILEAAPVVAELLRETTDVKVLVTSRAVLKLSSEHEYVVPPLPLPAPGDGAALAALGENDAVRLFVTRAGAVKPGFALSEQNRADVSEICRRLDGLPLAIELAAAQAKYLPPPALLRRLDRRLDALASGPRDLPDRQRTLRATFDWSFALLSADERRVFTRASVFVGGFQLSAAEAVNEDLGVDVLEVLFSLADKSLLRHEFRDDEPRFWQLEIVRDYAREKLNELEGVAGPSRRHRDYYLEFSRQADAGLLGHDQARWLDVVERELANVRAVLRRSLSHGELEQVVEMGWCLWRYWWIRGQHAEGQRWMEEAIARGPQLPPEQLVRAYYVAAAMAVAQADLAAAAPWVAACLETATAVGDRFFEGMARLGGGIIAMYTQDLPAASSQLGTALQIFRDTDDWWGQANLLHYLWRLEALQGRGLDEIGKLRESVELFHENGDRSALVLVLHDLAMMTLLAGDVGTTLKLLDEGFGHSLALNNRWYLAYCFEALACVAILQGDLPAGARYFGLADRLRDEVQTERTPFDEPLYAPYLAMLDRGLPDDERSAYAAEGRLLDVSDALIKRPVPSGG